ncbi:MAG: AMP-binding protein [Mycobacteriaceae bacterium]|nr:AMP-binding protein [Mycobacteriaceae bacterium]
MMRLPGVGLVNRIAVEVHAVATVTRAGMLGWAAPGAVVEMAQALLGFGPVGAAIRVSALRFGDRAALVDELGSLTYAELDQRSNALANAWRSQGIADGASVGVLCRNHRGFLDVMFAAAKAGVRALYLNTDFSGPQAADVCLREGVDALVYDEEFTEVVANVVAPKGRFLAWVEDVAAGERPATVESLIAAADSTVPSKPVRPGAVVMLTSGTTGLPKGAPRKQPLSMVIPGALLERIPLRGNEGVYVAPPMFHAWGFISSLLALGVGATLVTRRRFDPEAVLDAVERQRCGALVVVPVMLKRMLALGDAEIRRRDLAALHVIASGGAQLEGPLCTRVMDLFGDVVYSVYGSTECGDATIATPADLRAAPACVGTAPFGVTVKVLDEHGRPVPAGRTGRIFVGNTMSFAGYTGGGTKEMVDGLMSTGDVGHFDSAGRLFIDGRDDDMIVSGGENVFPQEVEELLAAHPGVYDAAVIGVDDPEFGKALRAFVVRRPGSDLDESEVRGYVRDNLARYKAPRSVVFLDELPRNPAGKVLKRELRALA